MAEGAALPLEELVELGLDPIPELRSPLSLPFFPILSLNPLLPLFPSGYSFHDPTPCTLFLM